AFGNSPGENNHVLYGESLLMGYRWYDSRHLPVAFPFGHGGSYTTFAWGQPRVVDPRLQPGGEVVVELEVKNTGERAGAEVVQLYVEPPAGRLFRPRRELKAFEKVWLPAGEGRTVRLALDGRAFAFWDEGSTESGYLAERLAEGAVVPAERGTRPVERPGWYVEAGTFRLLLARSVADVVSETAAEVTWSGPLG
ncbi:MAG: hypothetical protein JWO22_283, partial [Frankiales bacterium]|nr:hypothetical protein [Frankiales bacterium]